MGVDYTGYSNVCIKPVPKKYRSVQEEVVDKEKYLNILNDDSINMSEKSLFMMLKGIGYNRIKQDFVIPQKYKVTDEAYEWEENLRNDYDENYCNNLDKKKECLKKGEKYVEPEFQEELIMIDWQKNIMYYTTKETETDGIGTCYSSNGDFVEKCQLIYGSKFPYILPDTDTAPYNGFITGEIINSLHLIFKDIKENFSDKINLLVNEWDMEFFMRMLNCYINMFELALESGGIRVS